MMEPVQPEAATPGELEPAPGAPAGDQLERVSQDHNRRGPLADHQRAALARMAVAGLPHDLIARSLRRSPDSVKRLINHDPLVRKEIEQLEADMTRQLAIHHGQMLEMLEDCRSAYRNALSSPDLRLRFDAARYVESRVVPAQVQRSQVEVNLQGQVEHEVTGVLKGIVAHLSDLKEATQRLTPGLSIKTGPSALPGPQAVPIHVETPEDPADGSLPS